MTLPLCPKSIQGTGCLLVDFLTRSHNSLTFSLVRTILRVPFSLVCSPRDTRGITQMEITASRTTRTRVGSGSLSCRPGEIALTPTFRNASSGDRNGSPLHPGVVGAFEQPDDGGLHACQSRSIRPDREPVGPGGKKCSNRKMNGNHARMRLSHI